MTDFTKGLKVRLKSGGPNMTVTDVGTDSYAENAPHDRVWCQWFDDKMKLQKGDFPFEAVDIIE
ncbi:YodC family protein [Sphingomonas sp. MMS24-J13]|uniref:YodC family protein n=1 Tax=Sphingomonas sp. MMS24-J13 TaxID=3238686 RepID=UPI00384B325A